MKIAVLSSHTSSLFWFRVDMMKSFLAHGHEVYALGNEAESDWKDKFSELGIIYGTAVLLEEVGKVIKEGGTGVTVSSQSGHRMPALGAEIDEQLATAPTEELLDLAVLQPENIRDTLHAYQLAKRCNVKRVMYESVRWGERKARINSISPGIIVTPLAIDEFNGPRGDFYRNMFAKCPAGRPGTADEVASLAELMLDSRGAFITGSDFLIDGGATASYFYGPLKPQ